MTAMDESSGSSSAQPAQSGDCGCGCDGKGDCNEAKQPVNRARRSLMLGAGTVVLVSTLANRRAFAHEQCGPISHAMSLHPSHQGNQSGCGGLTPGFWKTHATCTAQVLGGNPANPAAAIAYCDTVTLGNKLSNLYLIDPISAGKTFKAALCDASSYGFHWAAAILDALSPAMNPSYGYTITELNNAVKAAYDNGLTAEQVVTALETLENDYNTNTENCAGGNSQHLC